MENICLIWKNQAVSKLNDELYYFLQEENKRKRKIQRKGFLLIFILLNVDLSKMRIFFLVLGAVSGEQHDAHDDRHLRSFVELKGGWGRVFCRKCPGFLLKKISTSC